MDKESEPIIFRPTGLSEALESLNNAHREIIRKHNEQLAILQEGIRSSNESYERGRESFKNELIDYCRNNKEKCRDEHAHLHEEMYDEAIKLLESWGKK